MTHDLVHDHAQLLGHLLHEAELLWIQPDGSALDRTGNPVVRCRAEFWGPRWMLTAAQLSRLDAKLDALVVAIDADC